VVNGNDLLQMTCNDGYKSAEHRVMLNTHEEPRVSIALFYNPGKREGRRIFMGHWQICFLQKTC